MEKYKVILLKVVYFNILVMPSLMCIYINFSLRMCTCTCACNVLTFNLHESVCMPTYKYVCVCVCVTHALYIEDFDGIWICICAHYVKYFLRGSIIFLFKVLTQTPKAYIHNEYVCACITFIKMATSMYSIYAHTLDIRVHIDIHM